MPEFYDYPDEIRQPGPSTKGRPKFHDYPDEIRQPGLPTKGRPEFHDYPDEIRQLGPRSEIGDTVVDVAVTEPVSPGLSAAAAKAGAARTV